MSSPPPGQWPPPPSGSSQGAPQWGPQPTGPSGRGGAAEWILGGLVLLVVVVITVVATLLVTRDGQESAGPRPEPNATAGSTPSPAAASANDRSPAGIILEDPTCQTWTPIAAAFGHASNSGWDQRNPAVPSIEWTPEQRKQYEAVRVAWRDAADRTVALARETPHRVMREIYEQFIAYTREYVSRIDDYTEPADFFARVSISTLSALNGICGAIKYGSAGARSPLVPAAPPPADVAPASEVVQPERFLYDENSVCPQWLAAVDAFTEDTAAWRTIDPNTPSSELTPADRAIHVAVMPVMESFATKSQLFGRESDNPVWADIATLSAQYLRAYVSALPTYSVADNYLQLAAGSAAGTISGACRAIGQ